MPRYIDADALYEITAEWEASAFAYVETLNRTPLEEMDDAEKDEWRRWTAILGERSAFKHDVADAPTADVRENVHASWVKVGQSFVYPNKFRNYACSKCGFDIEQKKFRFCPNCGAEMRITGKAGEKEKTEYEEQQRKGRSEEGSGDPEA